MTLNQSEPGETSSSIRMTGETSSSTAAAGPDQAAVSAVATRLSSAPHAFNYQAWLNEHRATGSWSRSRRREDQQSRAEQTEVWKIFSFTLALVGDRFHEEDHSEMDLLSRRNKLTITGRSSIFCHTGECVQCPLCPPGLRFSLASFSLRLWLYHLLFTIVNPPPKKKKKKKD